MPERPHNDPPTDARLSSSSSSTVRATGPRCGRASPSAHLLKIPRTKRDRHRIERQRGRSRRQSQSATETLATRQAKTSGVIAPFAHQGPWVDGKSPDLKERGRARRNVGDRLMSIRIRRCHAGQPDVERYIIRPRVGDGKIAKPMTGHQREVSGRAGYGG